MPKPSGRHYGGADRHSSSNRQHVAVGCGVRVVHTLGPPSGQSAGTTSRSREFCELHTLGAAADPPTEIQRMTTRQRHEQRDPHVPGAHRHCRGGRRKRTRAGLERTPTMRGKDMFTDMAIEELRGQIEALLRAGRSCYRSGTSLRALRRAGRYRREDLFHLRAPYRRPDQARTRCARRSSSGLFLVRRATKRNPRAA